MTHFLKIKVDELRNDINVYASRNMPWIEKVGAQFFKQLDVTPAVYIMEIVSGIWKFDEMAILLACIAHDIHAMLLIYNSYWTTHCNNEYAMTSIKLAYIGSGNFKFFVPIKSEEQVDALVTPSQMPNQSDAEDLADELAENLAETGLLPDEDAESSTLSQDSRSNDFNDADIEKKNVQDKDSSDAESSMLSEDSRANDFNDADIEKMDVDTLAEPVDTMDTIEGNASDMNTNTLDILGDPVNTALKPAEAKTSKGSTGSMDSQHKDNGYASDEEVDDDSDVILLGISVPDKPIGNIMGKVQRSRLYKCYLCGFQLEMQVTFITHFTSQHPVQPYQCDFCSGTFKSCNGLFKHEWSHQYLRYKCDLCGHKTQFPYQMKAHQMVHSGEGLGKCDPCERAFASKSSKVAHKKTHTMKLTCNKCVPGTSKVYTSRNSLRLHTHGKHGPGLTAPCEAHYVWKSQYTRHLKVDCKKCSKIQAQAKLKRYPFLKKIKKEKST